MKFIEDIFVSGNITDLSTVMYSLKRKIPVFNIYLVCVKENFNNTALILPCRESYKEEGLTVLGIAKGKKDANELMRHIMEYWYGKNETVYTFGKITEEEDIHETEY